ncbi:hypothetical protein LZ24_00539 [Desulfobotulus alkaliphilus]|uniref:Uncharacterized protein n=1 Tax=Desulfobotulus alkaliphilus TaxID=622671 RepID=A0A562S6F0_9BACT|nr:hypothetical protein LZ24_00539 [Desulfobotulus alkaliphilus]
MRCKNKSDYYPDSAKARWSDCCQAYGAGFILCVVILDTWGSLETILQGQAPVPALVLGNHGGLPLQKTHFRFRIGGLWKRLALFCVGAPFITGAKLTCVKSGHIIYIIKACMAERQCESEKSVAPLAFLMHCMIKKQNLYTFRKRRQAKAVYTLKTPRSSAILFLRKKCPGRQLFSPSARQTVSMAFTVHSL